jgi:two-component system chemotaxis sensor kinase CheA
LDELLGDFLDETGEHIEAVEAQLAALETNPDAEKVIGDIFRLFHTIKGSCGFLGLRRLATLAHAAETLLAKWRDGRRAPPLAVALIRQVIDQIEVILAELAASASEPEGDDQPLIGALEEAACLADPLKAAAAPQQGAGKPERSSRTASIRITASALEQISALTSELILARNYLVEAVRASGRTELEGPLQHLGTLTSEIQDRVMMAQMQPLARIFSTLPRLIRELSGILDKPIGLSLDGADIEIDRHQLERVREPLVHLLRNAADHGVESREARQAVGKPAVGSIRVSASQEGGYVLIAIADDGRGIDVDRIRDVAIARGLIGKSEAAALSEDDIQRLIFTPGLTTARTLSSISGRGIGLDAVRTALHGMGGTLSVSSKPGIGTCFTMKFPLTLAMASVLVVGIGTEKYALPQHAIAEVLGGRFSSAARSLAWRGEDLPLTGLAALLDTDRAGPTRINERAVVLAHGGQKFALSVESVEEVHEIVVKPLSVSLSEPSLFCANALISDGSIILVLDPIALADRLGLSAGQPTAQWAPAGPILMPGKPSLCLMFRASGKTYSLPIEAVTRIITVQSDDIGTGQDGARILRQGEAIAELWGNWRTVSPRRPAILATNAGRPLALLVDEILQKDDSVIFSIEEARAFGAFETFDDGGGCGSQGQPSFGAGAAS